MRENKKNLRSNCHIGCEMQVTYFLGKYNGKNYYATVLADQNIVISDRPVEFGVKKKK